MKTVAYTDETAKLVVKAFCKEIFRLRVVRHIFEELFENEESQILMERTAPSFFAEIKKILHSYLLLEFAKITDPTTSRGRQENFTLYNLIGSVD
jgi:hypothetical protein